MSKVACPAHPDPPAAAEVTRRLAAECQAMAVALNALQHLAAAFVARAASGEDGVMAVQELDRLTQTAGATARGLEVLATALPAGRDVDCDALRAAMALESFADRILRSDGTLPRTDPASGVVQFL